MKTAMVILYLWQVVAAGSGGRTYWDWVSQGDYYTTKACEAAGHNLDYDKRGYRCLSKE